MPTTDRPSLLLRALSLVLVILVGSACSSESAQGDTGNDDDDDTSSAGPGGDPPEAEEIDEIEPNDGPAADGFQDLGAFDASRTVKVTGGLSSGGNDGASYTGDFDVFAFSVGQDGGQIAITLDWEGAADVDIVLYDASLTPIAADAAGNRPITSSGAIPAGTYALALFSKDEAADWSLSIAYTLGGSGGGGSCVSPLAEIPGAGCSFTMNEPAQNGAAISLPYTFGWRSDGCETPGKVYFYGNPPTETNWVSFEYVRGGQESLLNVTGQHTLTEADLAGVTSDNGVYHWQLESFHGSRSVAWTFTVGGATCE